MVCVPNLQSKAQMMIAINHSFNALKAKTPLAHHESTMPA